MRLRTMLVIALLVITGSVAYVLYQNGEPDVTTSESFENSHVPEISPQELKALMDTGTAFVLLDVRRPEENEYCALPNSLLMPMAELESRVSELDTADQIVVYCRTGVRSFHATAFLQKLGYRHASNLTGGIHAWSDVIDSTLPKY